MGLLLLTVELLSSSRSSETGLEISDDSFDVSQASRSTEVFSSESIPSSSDSSALAGSSLLLVFSALSKTPSCCPSVTVDDADFTSV